MYPRQIEPYLVKSSRLYPIVTVTGPRQSGKTTLLKYAFADYQYVSLEDPDMFEFADSDPRGFLETYNSQVILDEVQNVPKLFSYLQSQCDANPEPGQFILSGSQQFLLNEKIFQSLSGRTAILRLVPLSFSELQQCPAQTYWQTGELMQSQQPATKLFEALYQGLYPRLHAYNIPPNEFYRDYVETYLSRDVRLLVNVGDINKFQLFLRLVAGRCGQLINLTALGNEVGVNHTTIQRWLTVLEASYIIYLLPPHFKNFNKRLTKSSKIYFLDSGLLCYLLKISSPEQLIQHPLIGGIFETFVFSELYKNFAHQNKEIPLYFWRDKTEKEIDILIDQGLLLFPIEIKSTQTFTQQLLRNFNYWLNLTDNPQTKGCLVYGGNNLLRKESILALPWYMIS